MEWSIDEAHAAERFGAIGLDLEGTLTWTANGDECSYALRHDGRIYPIAGKRTFRTIAALEEAFDALLPNFRLHAACCHQLMLRYFDEPHLQAAIDHWIASDALTLFKPDPAGFPWSSATQQVYRTGGGYLKTFGPPWTSLPHDATALPAWTNDPVRVSRFDPARPHVYLQALASLIEHGEPLWLAERMPDAARPVARRRL